MELSSNIFAFNKAFEENAFKEVTFLQIMPLSKKFDK